MSARRVKSRAWSLRPAAPNDAGRNGSGRWTVKGEDLVLPDLGLDENRSRSACGS